MVDKIPLEFQGTERFQVLRCLGQGANSVVYEVLDRKRDCRMALKTPTELTTNCLLSLRDEFQVLQGIKHPNIIRLEEWIEEDDRVYLTMELIEGVNFIEYVRSGQRHEEPAHLSGTQPFDLAKPHQLPRSGVDEERLRDALKQLTQAVMAIHQNRKVHRDLKPSNVLVTHSGRVVVLDFGLVTDADLAQSLQAIQPKGTAAYMAPEQAASEEVGPETDFYCMGSMLYEALTGQVPFWGTPFEILTDKMSFEPPPPSDLVRDVPPDLEALCMDLLRINPESRPTGREMLRRLETRQINSNESLHAIEKRTQVFVGRTIERQTLEEAYERTRQGKAIAVLVEGESGVGKTALVENFVQRLHVKDPSTVILSGRYYEGEAHSYKAMVGVVEELGRFLRRFSERQVKAYLPQSLSLLREAFPELRLVKSVLEAPVDCTAEVMDPQERRSRLFASLRELFERLANRHPLVIVIDDLHWADADSMAMIAELLRPPEAPPLLFIGMLRTEPDRSTNLPHAKALASCDVRWLKLGPLRPKDALELANCLADQASIKASEIIREVADKSEGHPLFIHEFLHYATSHGGTDAGSLSLEEVLLARAKELDLDAQNILQLIAVAGRPVAQRVVWSAALTTPKAFRRHLKELCEAKLVRKADAAGGGKVSVYHDRIREAVLASLDASELERLHRDLALALESHPRKDPEHLAVHWLGAGEHEHASFYMLQAAELAEASFAFDQAAELYQTVLQMGGKHASLEVQLKLGHALTNAGRWAKAAQWRLKIADHSDTFQALQLRCQAAGQLMCSGHFDRGVELLSEVLRAFSVFLPASSPMTILSLLFWRMVLKLRGLKFKKRDAGLCPLQELTRIDTLNAAGSGFAMTDNVRGSYFQTRSLIHSLNLGEPHRLAHALAMETCFTSTGGQSSKTRTYKLLKATKTLADELQTGVAQAFFYTAKGYYHYFLAEWAAGKDAFSHAEKLYVEQCVGQTFYLNSVRTMLYRALFYFGDLVELAARVTQTLHEMEQVGDIYGTTNLRCGPQVWLGLADDGPAGVIHDLRQAEVYLPKVRFLVQHYFHLQGIVQTALYEGRFDAAYELVEQKWRALKRSMLLRINVIRIEAFETRGRAALAMAAAGHRERSRYLANARRAAKKLEKEKMPWACGTSALLNAGIAKITGDVEETVRLTRLALNLYQEAAMPLYEEAARRRLGELVGGEEGRALVESADTWMANQAIKNPASWTRMLAPGFE